MTSTARAVSRRLIKRALGAAALAVAMALGAACGARRAPPDSAPESCPGSRVVAVRNSSPRPLDVFVSAQAGGGGGQFIGTAEPGVSTLPVPPGAGKFFYARAQNQASSALPRTAKTGTNLSFTPGCR